jgi:hypothetical protein
MVRGSYCCRAAARIDHHCLKGEMGRNRRMRREGGKGCLAPVVERESMEKRRNELKN